MAGRGKPQTRASSRSAARLAAVQALYQMDMTGIDLNEVIAEFEAYRLGKEIEDCQYCDAEAAFFRDLVDPIWFFVYYLAMSTAWITIGACALRKPRLVLLVPAILVLDLV